MSEEPQFLELNEVGISVLDCEHKTPPDAGSGYPYIAIPNLVDGRIDLSSVRRITESDYVRWTQRSKPQAGDVLVTRRGRVGDSAPIPPDIDCAIGQNIVILRSDESRVLQSYLRWVVRGPLWQAEVERLINVGAVFSSLNVRDIARMRIPVHPPRAQAAISAILGALDDKIAVNDGIAATARRLGQALFVEASQEMPRTELLRDITELLTRGITPKYSDGSESVCVINQKCIRDGRVNLSLARRTLRSKIKEPKYLKRHDILVNSTGVGTLGRVAIWAGGTEATTDSHVTIVRFDPKKVDQLCTGFAILNSEADIELLGEGSTGQTELSWRRLGELPITIPSNREVGSLRPELDALEARANAALEESEKLTEMRDTLLPKLTSGEIRIRDGERAVEEAT